MKVVIADDEPLARERLRALLADEPGVQVVAEAGDGHATLHACAEHHPDMVLLDISMPGIDGLETARHLAAFEPRPAVVFCTAYDAHALSAFDAQAIDYLVKPVRPERLSAALERVRTFAAGRALGDGAREHGDGSVVLRAHVGQGELWVEAVVRHVVNEPWADVAVHRGVSSAPLLPEGLDRAEGALALLCPHAV